jgi:hypothetical protein
MEENTKNNEGAKGNNTPTRANISKNWKALKTN